MLYQFKFKKGFFFKKRSVIGHRHDANLDKMVLFYPDGGVEEIPHWREHKLVLGADFAASQKKYAEEQKTSAAPMALAK